MAFSVLNLAPALNQLFNLGVRGSNLHSPVLRGPAAARPPGHSVKYVLALVRAHLPQVNERSLILSVVHLQSDTVRSRLMMAFTTPWSPTLNSLRSPDFFTGANHSPAGSQNISQSS
jgi:hypothetical protein